MKVDPTSSSELPRSQERVDVLIGPGPAVGGAWLLALGGSAFYVIVGLWG